VQYRKLNRFATQTPPEAGGNSGALEG